MRLHSTTKKKSRGQRILKNAVHIFSEKEGIKVRTNQLSNKEEYENFIKLKADLVVVIAYGQIIPEIFWIVSAINLIV